MEKLAGSIVRHRKCILVVFSIFVLVSALLSTFVGVNYNMADYLPPNAQSTKALEIMEEAFSQSIPNANVMVKNVSLMEAMDYKQKLAAIEGVTQVLWLDDVIDIKIPLVMSDQDTIGSFYKNDTALFNVTIAKGMEKQACNAILGLIGADNALAGEAPSLVTMQDAAGSETLKAMLILLPAILLILLLSTTSWIEPALFLVAIGISIAINMGTNVFFGRISFVTKAVTPILQLACSLDYAIFLLHSFADNRKKYADAEEAMRRSIQASMSTVAASAMTTLFGFLALLFMNFRIGADLGINLAKGIILSFLSVMLCLPALTLLIYKFIDRTKHRELMPSFQNVHNVLSKLFIPMVVLVVLFIIPSFLGQGHTEFAYGNDSTDATARTGRDKAAIEEEFGKSTIVALLVPNVDVAKEQALCAQIKKMDHVTGIASYAASVGATLPPEFIGTSITSQFYSENYARIIVYTDTPSEGEIAFGTVDAIQAAAISYYGETVYLAGQSANTNDMKNVVQQDMLKVNLAAIVAIFCVLFITFRSFTLPIILLLTIETGIWVNLAIPYFSGITINFMGYLIISSVQLGATVDYAILLTNNYMTNRKQMPQREALHAALGQSFKPILISGIILASAGFTLYATSSSPVVYEMGMLVGRGAMLSMVLVVCFLPALLSMLDRTIERTTYQAGFCCHKNERISPLEKEHEQKIR